MTEVASLHVAPRALPVIFSKESESEQIFTIVLQSRTKNFDDGASIGDADRLLQLLRAVGDVRLGANESAKRKQFCSLKN